MESTDPNAHRTGIYAEQYRIGASVRAGTPIIPMTEIQAALDSKKMGQGYRDGLKGAPYRVPKKGTGSQAKQAERSKKYRAEKKKTHVYVASWIKK